jgi:hypothetical protein
MPRKSVEKVWSLRHRNTDGSTCLSSLWEAPTATATGSLPTLRSGKPPGFAGLPELWGVVAGGLALAGAHRRRLGRYHSVVGARGSMAASGTGEVSAVPGTRHGAGCSQ